MTELVTDYHLPAGAEPYVVRHGRGLRHLVAGEIVTTLAGGAQTAGAFGVLVADTQQARGPIPMHYHEREYDTWLCTRGQLRVWAEDQCRTLRPGDFAYAAPFARHSYQGVSPRMGFFGVVAPGGWEQFMADAGEVWGMTGLPPADRPFDFSRMGPAMAKHDVHRVPDAAYAEPTAMGADDHDLPADGRSYYLEAGHGPRATLLGHLATTLITRAQTGGTTDMLTIEAGRDAAMPLLRHRATATFLYVLAGEIALTLDGQDYRLTGGDGANIPAGTAYATCVTSGNARWVMASGNGDGGAMWHAAGTPCPGFCYPLDDQRDDGRDRLAGLAGVDVELA
ncbi:quercetin 2,3-dioxygenase family protein (plasmid) [Croceibacterium sp. TMG7-5b_MA50]|uniref:cupin domain-containing protein n=1 Tax=Croceibacterium sp. TMG7-5b_MA50 TaxID=3121290 RepID=UPI003221DF71